MTFTPLAAAAFWMAMRGAGVEVGEDEHLRAVGQALVSLVALLLGVALRVVDDVG